MKMIATQIPHPGSGKSELRVHAWEQRIPLSFRSKNPKKRSPRGKSYDNTAIDEKLKEIHECIESSQQAKSDLREALG